MFRTIIIGLLIVTSVLCDVERFNSTLENIRINDESNPKLIYANVGSNITLSCYGFNKTAMWNRVKYHYFVSDDGKFVSQNHLLPTVLDKLYNVDNNNHVITKDLNWYNLTLIDVTADLSGTYECKTASEKSLVVKYEIVIFPLPNSVDLSADLIYMIDKVKLRCALDERMEIPIVDRDTYVAWLVSTNGTFSFVSYNGNILFDHRSNHELDGSNLIVHDKLGLYVCYNTLYYSNPSYTDLPRYDVVGIYS